MPQERMTLEQYRALMGLGPVQPATGMKKANPNEYGFIPSSKIEPGGKQRPSKYGAKKTKVDGVVFHSKAEADYYCELKILEDIGDVWGFCRQPEFILQDGDGGVIRYKPDFIVWHSNGEVGVIEVKGMPTPDWIIREKLFRARFPKIKLVVVK